MKSLSELLLDAPRLGDKYGVNLRARLTDERFEELFDGAEFTSDELKLLRALGPWITHTEDREWWDLLVQHLPPPVTSSMVPTFRKAVHPPGGYETVDRKEVRPWVLRVEIITREERSLE